MDLRRPYRPCQSAGWWPEDWKLALAGAVVIAIEVVVGGLFVLAVCA